MRDSAIAKAKLPANAVVADFGTGSGFVARGLAALAAKVYGIDANSEMAEVAKQNLQGFSNLEFRVVPGHQIPLPDKSLDGVFANMYLHHDPQPERAIHEMARVLIPGGVLCITDLDPHKHEWQREQMADLWLGFERDAIRKWRQLQDCMRLLWTVLKEPATHAVQTGAWNP